MPKTLIFSFDGTGNEPGDSANYREDESVSNILKLHVLLGGGTGDNGSAAATPAGNPQVTHYYNGIGTGDGKYVVPLMGRLIARAQSMVNQAIAPTWGDARRILGAAHDDFIAAGYQPGDTLAVFGFSRGAALARKFVAQLLQDERREVSFLGLFDTVAAMNGIHRPSETVSSDVLFENGTLHRNVKRAVHIVSLDEDRTPFTPTLINQDATHPDRILEIWFPGVHSDVGGGYWHDGLSDLALRFMVEQCEGTLRDAVQFIDGANVQAIRKAIEDQGDGLEGIDVDDIVIHPMAEAQRHTHSGLLAKAGGRAPRQVCVWRDDRPSGELPLVHHSVKERFRKVSGYRPPALRARKFRLYGGSQHEEVRGICELR